MSCWAERAPPTLGHPTKRRDDFLSTCQSRAARLWERLKPGEVISGVFWLARWSSSFWKMLTSEMLENHWEVIFANNSFLRGVWGKASMYGVLVPCVSGGSSAAAQRGSSGDPVDQTVKRVRFGETCRVWTQMNFYYYYVKNMDVVTVNALKPRCSTPYWTLQDTFLASCDETD